MDLGSGIRKALAAITGASLVDEAAVKTLTRELQRTLITNDVNVRLVFQITKRIEERALKEKPSPGLALREHVVKVVFEELESLLGKERFEPKIGRQRILLCGLFGAGKCVHPNTQIYLPNGSLPTAAELYSSLEGVEDALEDGFIKHVKPFNVYAFDPSNLKLVEGKCDTLWKLKKTQPLIKVAFDNGNNHSITTTPEHPFFVLEDGAISPVRADELHLGQRVAVPAQLPVEPRESALFEDLLAGLDPRLTIWDSKLTEKITHFVTQEFGSIINANKILKANYCHLTQIIKRGRIPVSLFLLALSRGFSNPYTSKDQLNFQLASSQKIVRFPLHLSPDFAEFLGYFYGDGHAREGYLEVTSAEPEVVNRLKFLAESLFGVNARVTQDRRRKSLFNVILASKTLVTLFKNAFGIPIGRKSRTMQVPRSVLTASNETLTSFLSAYFDCDGFAEKNKRSIEFLSASKPFARQLRFLLLRFGLFSAFSKKTVSGREYYRIFLRSGSAEKFASIINSRVPFKRNRLKQYATIGVRQTRGDNEMLYVGPLLREVRRGFGATIGEVQKHVSSYGLYEDKGRISRKSLNKFLDYLPNVRKKTNELLSAVSNGVMRSKLLPIVGEPLGWLTANLHHLDSQGLISCGSQIQLTRAGKQYLQKQKSFDYSKLKTLQLLAESDLNWLTVSSLETNDSEEFVYDLTVNEYHNFVANGVFVHNTTAAGKLAHYYSSKGLKSLVIAADVHRPAAFEQLQQLAGQAKVGFYGLKGEKDAVKIAREARALEKDYDVLILDSAGRSAFDEELVAELKSVNEAFAPDYKFLVVSADLGQVAGKQAKEFDEAVGLSGVIVSKMDGSGKGGGALSSVAVSGARIAFLGTGEKLRDLEPFDVESFVGALVGFPNIKALMEKAREASDEETMEKALSDGKLDYESFLAQMRAMQKMGPLKQVMQMLGVYDVPEEALGQSEAKLKQFEAAVLSMTPGERKKPDLMKQSSRQARVARGAGVKDSEVKELVKNFGHASKMVKQLGRNRGFLKGLGKRFPGMAGMK